MNEQLLLSNIRGVLIRLEDTILFGLIERAQFRTNPAVYQRGAVAAIPDGESVLGFLLHETERAHARIRRYTSPDEEPFFDDLPQPFLPPLSYEESPLRPNEVNLSKGLREVYEKRIVPHVCREGDDGQYGSSSVCDVGCLQDMGRRIHTGKFVAESKYRTSPRLFQRLIDAGSVDGLMGAITDTAVEETVLARVRRKASMYVRDLATEKQRVNLDPERLVEVFSRWLIPLTKHVEVQYLLQRREPS